VSYFRWRQSKFAQEQMHSGLLLPNSEKDIGYFEVNKLNEEIQSNKEHFDFSDTNYNKNSKVAIMFDYEAEWVLEIQPQGKEYLYSKLVYLFYKTVRRYGVNVDIVNPNYDLSSYEVLFIPTLPYVNTKTLSILKRFKGITSSK
jgi:beta-galactosidase